MFDQSFNISPCDFAEVCPEVSLFESKNFEFEDVVLFNVSADRPQGSVKGKLFKSIEHWQFLGAPDFILSIIKSRYKISALQENGSAVNECECAGYAILELLRDNRIEEVFSSPDIVNPLSVSVHSSGKKSLILDLRHVNLHIYKQKFRCEDLHTIKNVFSKGFFVFSYDLKSGYHHVDIFHDHRKYLALSWDFGKGHTRYFQLTVLSFGLSSAPFIFYQVVKTTGNPLEVTCHILTMELVQDLY